MQPLWPKTWLVPRIPDRERLGERGFADPVVEVTLAEYRAYMI